MRGLKIAIIGAGSTYTPELIEGFIERQEQLKVDSFFLMDIDPKKLDIIGGLAKRMLEAKGHPGKMILTSSLDEAIEGADYILAQIRVGGLEARIKDEKIPAKYDLLGQETTGAGGFMNALRTIPVIMNMVERIKMLAPEAWLINFSNPSGILAEAVLNHSNIKMLGLCNVPMGLVKDAEKLLPPGTQSFSYDYVGLNHLSWITAVYADGKEILSEKIGSGLEVSTMKNIPHMDYDIQMLKAVNAMPSSYLNYFYLRDEQKKHASESGKTRGEECMNIEAGLLELYQDKSLNRKPELLEKRGGAYYSTAAVSLIDAIENDKNEIHVVNVKNCGALPFMDDDDAVEVKCLVNRRGVTPVKIDKFDNPHIVGLMKAVKAYEKLTVLAGLKGSKEAALSALMVHPLIGDYIKARDVLEDMLEANKAYLPQFFKGDNQYE